MIDKIIILLIYIGVISGMFAFGAFLEWLYLTVKRIDLELDNVRKCAYNKRIKWALRIKKHG